MPPWLEHSQPEKATMPAPVQFKRPGAPPPPPQPPPDARRSVAFGAITSSAGHRIVIYGPGGIGKTTLAAHLPPPVGFIDLDESLPRLKNNLDELALLEHLSVVQGVSTWDELRKALQNDGWKDIATVVIDSATKAEELCIAHTLENVPHEKGTRVARLEDYGYGKGYQHVYENFLPLLADLDRHCRQGRNVVLVCHDCTANVPNPAGEDWLRYEPRLQSPSSGKASIRLRVREWADHVLFLGYDVAVTKEGKGQGSGTRTLYACELPHCMAKSRSFQGEIPVGNGDEIWSNIIK